MKRTFAMNIIRKLRGAAAPGGLAFAGIVALGLGALLFSACENPFRAGLGRVVDLHYPTVSLVSPAPGSTVRGVQGFTGTAWDDLELYRVWIKICPGPEGFGAMLRDGVSEDQFRERGLHYWQPIASPSVRARGNWEWRHGIDTRMFRDGALSIRLRVRDGYGKETENPDPIIFTIRNDPPVITMDLPRLPELAGENRDFGLNFGLRFVGGYGEDDPPGLDSRGVDSVTGVSVMITDDNGLSMNQRFRIWEIYERGTTPLGGELSSIRRFRDDRLPSLDEVPWQIIGPANSFLPDPVNRTSMMFFHDFPDAARGRFFAIQIRAESSAQDGAGYMAYFPRDEWAPGQWDYWYGNNPERYVENSFVAFLVEAPQEPPHLERLRFQDVLNGVAWNPGLGDFDDLPNHPDQRHYFLTETTNVKQGPFALRVRVSHIEGVSDAVAFWYDGEHRGLLIWDFETPGVDFAGNRFTAWGHVDRHRPVPTRNFIFTYRGNPALDTHESGNGVHASARGSYRIQRFTGDNWAAFYSGIRAGRGWDALHGANWADENYFGCFWGTREGRPVTISVYARTRLGGVNATPLVTTVSVDTQAPTVILSEIVGSAWEGTRGDETFHVVNDVIRPRLSVDDAASGLRNVARPGGGQDEEIVFVLIDEDEDGANRAAMGALAPDFWPLAPGAALDSAPNLPGVTVVHRYGPVRERSMYIHIIETYPVGLPDGFYRLYVFARDRAFNVARYSFLLYVDAESDRPRFYFDMGIYPGVRDPDVFPAIPSQGFYYDGRTRNRLRPADDIRFTIRDDDGLDLTTLQLSITKSRVEGDRVEVVGYPVPLPDSVVRRVFPPPQTGLPVREMTGVILQRYFADALFGTGSHTRLPDGIYRISMTVSDDPAHKLGAESRRVSRTEEFWIAIDEVPPSIVIPGLSDGDSIPTGDAVITGTVSDANAPIDVVRFGVRHNVSGGYWDADADNMRDWVSLSAGASAGSYGFSARICMDEFFGPYIPSGEFVFELAMRDRFGNVGSRSLVLQMDNEPPEVAIRPGMGIRTFARPSAASRMPGGSVGVVGTPAVNATRLANRAIRFTVDATDNFAVTGINWWLLPADIGYGIVQDNRTGWVSRPGGGTVDTFYAVPHRISSAELGRVFLIPGPSAMSPPRGAFGRVDPSGRGEVIIDTYGLRLPDGEYRLHVIAVDGAGNQSIHRVGVTSYMQTIFLFQDEDRPYFASAIRPSAGDVRGEDLVVTGIIMDDDGFGTGLFPDPGSVEIWISTTNNLAGEPSSDALGSAGWHHAVPEQGLTLIDGTNLVLEINLENLAWDPPFEFRDGMKFYVVRARDFSPYQAYRYYPVLNFMRDAEPPELNLTSPAPGQIVGAEDFYLEGSIADANLSLHNGNPYLLWRLNGSPLARFELTAGFVTGGGTGNGIETVYFRIPHADIFTAGLLDGSNTLELRVEDRTGAPSELSLAFVRDTTPPQVDFRTPVRTFSRYSAADRIPADSVGRIGSDARNALRLANSVISFTVYASDNLTVGGIHWWLLPATTGATETGVLNMHTGGTVSSFHAYPSARGDIPVGGTGIINIPGPTALTPWSRGAFGRVAPPGGEVLIDTRGLGLPDGEYRLHIVAVDGAGNQSTTMVNGVVGFHAQTVFLFQDEDRPYFAHGISPSAGDVRGGNLVLTGDIRDDDGFGTGMFPDPGSVEIWISANNNLNLAPGARPNRDMLYAAGWHSAVPTNDDGLTLIDGTNLVMEIDLYGLFSSHPDFAFGQGMKHFVIRAQDSAANKLAVNEYGQRVTATERTVSYSQVHSFMRDTEPPVLELAYPAAGQVFGRDAFYLRGSIADANLGADPVLMWRLNGDGTLAGLPLVAGDGIAVGRETIGGIETFSFSISPDRVSRVFGSGLTDGANTLELRVYDLAGLNAELSRGFIRDTLPPELSIRTEIATFSRASAAGRIPGITNPVGVVSAPAVNATRLANSVLRFAVDAIDNVEVYGIRWWLLPADVGPVDSFSFTFDGASGAFGWIDPDDGVAYIDTRGLNLPDGEYRLHVIAVDGVGNESIERHGVTSYMQTIFLFQAEDGPYFASAISPSGGVHRDNVVITGVVTDDDGFGTGMFPDPRSVQILISRDEAIWHTATVPNAHLELIDGTSLVLSVNLHELAWDPPFSLVDGMVYYWIRVQDSVNSRLWLPGTDDNDRESAVNYSQVFSFMRDTSPPALTLVSPVAGQGFGVDAFYLEGSIADANLSLHNGNPYLLWRLNSYGTLARLPLVQDVGFTVTDTEVAGIRTVDFRISPDRVEEIFGFDTTSTQTGPGLRDGLINTLELRVEDLAGHSDELSRGFIMDVSPPELSVRTEIATFSRASAAGRIPGIPNPVGVVSTPAVNATRLANSVLRFAVDATDNVAVYGIHWWLVPANSAIVESFWSYPAGTPGALAVPVGRAHGFTNAGGVRGAFGRVAVPGGVVYIDTRGLNLPYGEYRLHVIAVDGADNESRFLRPEYDYNVVQTIFLFQAEDMPYFASGIGPDGGRNEVRGNDMVITGTITDDDGFGGMHPDPESVQVWISRENNLGHGSRPTVATGWQMAIVPIAPGSGLSLIDGTSLVLDIDLLGLFPNFFAGDGMVYYVIRVQDSVGSRLWLPGTPDSERESAVSYSRVFSFMRDTTPPALELDSLEAGQAIAGDTFNFAGTIEDANLARHNFGTAVEDYRYFIEWRLNGQGPLTRFPLDAVDPGNPRVEVSFSIPLSTVFGGGSIPDGNHSLELRAGDRAGLSTEISRSFIIDSTPPEVGLRPGMEIATFRRDSAANRMPSDSVGVVSTPAVNATRLANSFIRFAVDATDNTVVEAIHWWLVPAGEELDYSDNEIPYRSLFWAFPATEDNPQTALGTGGAFGRIAGAGGEVYIDTRTLDLPDGEYRLHVIARDQAGNESRFLHLEYGYNVVQTIFLFQDEDRPYFTPGIRPGDNELLRDNLVITGVITDDDGFGTGMFPDAGSVQVWISRENNLGPGARPTVATGWQLASVPSTHLSLIDGTSLVLGIDLMVLFPAFFRDNGMDIDGTVHYVIRAQDSLDSRLWPPGTPVNPQTRAVSYSQVFSFIRDANPPVLTLEYPEPGEAIRTADLVLSGSIADANLGRHNFGTDVTPDYRFYMEWRLNGPGGAWNRFSFADDDMDIVGGLETVEFDLLGNAAARDLFDDAHLPNAVNTLELRATDRTGAVTEYSRTFIIDDVPPAIELQIYKVPLVTNAVGDDRTPAEFFTWWWTEPTANDADRLAWNNARREWAEGRELTVIEPEGRIAWLAGSFSDDHSDIDLSTVEFWINDETVARDFFQREGAGGLITWRIPLTEGGTTASADDPLPDGVHTVSVRVSDAAGNARSTETFAFRIDGDAPQIGIDPQDGNHTVFGSPPTTSANGSAFTIQGTATDANLRYVRLEMLCPDGSNVLTHTSDIGDAISTTWNYEYGRLTGFVWSFAVSWDVFDDLPPGIHEVRATAMDWRGEVSEQAIWHFTKDTASPVIGFPGRAAYLRTDDYDPVVNQNQFENTPNIERGTIQVTVSDNSGIRRMQRLLERWTWDSSTVGSWNPVHMYDGDGYRVSDADGWGDIPSAATTNRTWGLPVDTLPEGLYRLRVRALDDSWFDGHGEDFSATSSGNPATSDWLYFFRDTAVPTVEFSLPLTMSSRFGTGTDTPGTQDHLGFTVTAADTNTLGLRQLTVEIDYRIPDPAGLVEYLERSGTVTVDVFAGDHDRAVNVFDIRLPVSYNALDGMHTITVTATDFMRRYFAREERFTLDNSPPDGDFHPMVGNLLAGGEWRISGEAIDPTGVARMDFRIGRIGDNEPTEAALAGHYLSGATPGRDTSRNNSIFDYAGTWFPLVANPQGTARHPYIRVENHSPFNWELLVEAEDSVDFVAWLRASANEHLIDMVGGIIELPIWFRAVDNQGNAGFFGDIVRINPYADRPSLEINTPSETAANIDNQRGGRVDLGGFARIDAPIRVHSVLYRVWVGGQGDDTDPTRPTRLVTAGELGATPAGDDELDFLYYRDGDWEEGWLMASVLIPDGVTGNNAPWNFTLNAGGEIANLIMDHGFNRATGLPGVPADRDTIRVWVEIIALNGVDTDSSRESDLRVVSFYLRDSAPEILLATVTSGDTTVTYWDGAPQWDESTLPHRGRFTIRAIIDAASSQTLRDVRIARLDEVPGNLGATPAWDADRGSELYGVTVTAITTQVALNAALGTAAPTVYPFPDDRFWTLTYVLDPAEEDGTSTVGTVRNGTWATTGGLFRVEIRARDDATPRVETTQTLPILLDNFAPVVDPNHVTNPTQAGTSGRFMGRTLDFSTAFASPSHVDRIYAWFVRDINGIQHFVAIDERANNALSGWNLRTIPSGVPGAGMRLWTDIRVGRTADVSGTGLATTVYVTNEGTPAVPPIVSPAISANAAVNGGGAWVRVISGPRSAAESGTGRRDAIFWDARDGGRYVEWGFTIDTTRLPDGPLTLNYIVMDHNGNASFHQQHVVIMNNFPEISRLILHTSNTDVHQVVITDGGFEPGTYMHLPITADDRTNPDGFIESGFTARNSFIGFTVEARGGNAPLRYRLQHVTRSPRVPLNAATLTEMFNDSTGVDMFTIAATGTVSHDTWRRLGVHANRTPVPGMHFAFRPVDPDGRPLRVGDDLTATQAVQRFNLAGTGAEIFRYTAHRTDEYMPAGTGLDQFGFNLLVDPNEFNFAGYDFGGTITEPEYIAGRIPQFVTYTPLATGSIPSGAELNALRNHPHRPFFLIRVWDDVIAGMGNDWDLDIDTGVRSNDRLHDAVVIAADIFLADTLPPTVRFHDLNPGFETRVDGNNLSDDALVSTITDALDPTDPATNVIRGGLFNIGTEREPIRSGHIEPRTASQWDRAFDVSGNPSSNAVGAPLWRPADLTAPATTTRAHGSNRLALASGYTIARDLVSGQIMLRGRAWDNQRITSVQLAITLDNAPPTLDDWVTILEWENDGLRPADEDSDSAYENDVGLGEVAFWETLHWEDGHDIEWAVRWNTELFNNGAPADNVRVSIRVSDSARNSDVVATPPTNPAIPVHFNVDIVPYIVGFERWGPAGAANRSYVTIRSMQGWYSFYQGELRITAMGFNLGALGTVPTMNIAGTVLATGDPITTAGEISGVAELAPPHGRTDRMRGFVFSVPSNAQSGRIDITTPLIHNHRSDHTRFWNSEDFLDARSRLWINRPYAHIWRTAHYTDDEVTLPRTFMGPLNNSIDAEHIGMGLEFAGTETNRGRLHGTWALFGESNIHYGHNVDGPSTTQMGAGMQGEPFVTPDISILAGTVNYDTHAPNIAFVHMTDGNPPIRFRARGNTTGAATTPANSAGHINFPFLVSSAGRPTQNWGNLRVSNALPNITGATNATISDPGRLFATVYDSQNSQLVFIGRYGANAGTAGATVTSGTGVTAANAVNNSNRINIDGRGVTGGIAGTLAPSPSAGQFSAIGFDQFGPIVAYSDFTNDTIRIAFADTAAPTAITAWRRQHVIDPAVNRLHRGSGRYVSMVVDRNNRVHLAFFNSNYGVVYARGHRASAAAYMTWEEIRVVDSVNGVGLWTDISVDYWGNPWIVYGYRGRMVGGNFDGIRMAFRTTATGGDASPGTTGAPRIHFGRANSCRATGQSIQGWEAVQMAAPFRVTRDRLNIESWPPSTATRVQMDDAHREGGVSTGREWHAAIGYASGAGDNRFRIGYFFRPNMAAWPPAVPASTP